MSLPSGAQTDEPTPAPTPETSDEKFNAQLDQMVEDSAGPDEKAATTEDATKQTETPKSDDGKQAEPKASDTATPDATASQQQPVDDSRRSIRGDKDGNLVDGSGNIIAKAGKERRLWEDNNRLRHVEIPKLSRQLAEVQGQLNNTTALNGLPQQLGLSPEQAVQGMRMIASYMNNPIATLKLILTEAKAAGHNLEQLGLGGGTLDHLALGRMIDDRLKPILDDRASAQENADIERKAQEQYDAFMTTFPDASLHEDAIANLMNSNPSLTPEAAYYKLKNYVLENGLDWGQPLRPQVEARQQGAQQQQPQNTPATPQAPMNVRGSQQQVPNKPVNDSAAVADVDASYRDIVRSTLQEHGFNVP